jgi:hypothetical protein
MIIDNISNGPKWIAVVLSGHVTADVCERQTDGTYVGVAGVPAGIEVASEMAQALNDRDHMRVVTS